MQFRVSRTTERLVGTLDTGEDIVEVLTRLCENRGVTAGSIRAVGLFDSLQLVRFDPVDQSWAPVVDGEGHFELVGLDGSVSMLGDEIAIRLDAVFNAAGPAGVQTVGGQLRSARAVDAEFVVEVFDDVVLQRRLDAETGRLVLDEVARDSDSAPPDEPSDRSEPTATDDTEGDGTDTNGGMSWDDAIAEAERTEEIREKKRSTPDLAAAKKREKKREKKKDPYADFDFDEPLMSSDDILDHKKLGRCRILDVEDDEYVRVRLPKGGIRKLMLKVLDIEFSGEEDGRRVFEARVRR